MTSKPLMELLILDFLNISMAGSTSLIFFNHLFSMSSAIDLVRKFVQKKFYVFVFETLPKVWIDIRTIE